MDALDKKIDMTEIKNIETLHRKLMQLNHTYGVYGHKFEIMKELSERGIPILLNAVRGGRRKHG